MIKISSFRPVFDPDDSLALHQRRPEIKAKGRNVYSLQLLLWEQQITAHHIVVTVQTNRKE